MYSIRYPRTNFKTQLCVCKMCFRHDRYDTDKPNNYNNFNKSFVTRVLSVSTGGGRLSKHHCAALSFRVEFFLLVHILCGVKVTVVVSQSCATDHLHEHILTDTQPSTKSKQTKTSEFETYVIIPCRFPTIVYIFIAMLVYYHII